MHSGCQHQPSGTLPSDTRLLCLPSNAGSKRHVLAARRSEARHLLSECPSVRLSVAKESGVRQYMIYGRHKLRGYVKRGLGLPQNYKQRVCLLFRLSNILTYLLNNLISKCLK